jgi:hypothetical protein
MQAVADGQFSEQRSDGDKRRSDLWRSVTGGLAVVAGVVGAGLVLFYGGLIAGFSGCADGGGMDPTTFCPGNEDLASALEIAALIPGVLAPLAGGIVTCVTQRPRWLVIGLAVGAVMLAILIELASGQQSLMN